MGPHHQGGQHPAGMTRRRRAAPGLPAAGVRRRAGRRAAKMRRSPTFPACHVPSRQQRAGADRNLYPRQDENRPHRMAAAFAADAQLRMTVKTEAIAFPAATEGPAQISDVLVRRFGQRYDNVYTFCRARRRRPTRMRSPAPAGRHERQGQRRRARGLRQLRLALRHGRASPRAVAGDRHRGDGDPGARGRARRARRLAGPAALSRCGAAQARAGRRPSTAWRRCCSSSRPSAPECCRRLSRRGGVSVPYPRRRRATRRRGAGAIEDLHRVARAHRTLARAREIHDLGLAVLTAAQVDGPGRRH